jgi:methionyl-tRNA formyltransferase
LATTAAREGTLISFLVLGDGYAAAKVATSISRLPDARIAAVALAKPPPGGALNLGGESVEAIAAELLRRPAGLERVLGAGVDWLLCINSTVILPAELLELFEGRALNGHPGPLPEYGGLHAHQWAIRHGRTEYGATVHRMDPLVDAGPVLAATRFPIHPEDTGLSLFRRAISAAAELLTAVAASIAAGEAITPVPQDLSRRRLWRHAEALDGGIDWSSPARAVVDFVRAGNYEPFASPTYVATFKAPLGTPIEVLRAAIAGPTDRPPGDLVALEETGPLIACGDHFAVRLARARDAAGVIDAEGWRRHFSPRG